MLKARWPLSAAGSAAKAKALGAVERAATVAAVPLRKDRRLLPRKARFNEEEWALTAFSVRPRVYRVPLEVPRWSFGRYFRSACRLLKGMQGTLALPVDRAHCF
jgi:hypothetical protein